MERLERGFSCLQAEDWTGAAACFMQVLAKEPENSQAHLGKLLADLHAGNVESLKDLPFPFDNHMSYRSALPYLDPDRKSALEVCIDHIRRRNEQDRLKTAYEMAKERMDAACSEADYLAAARLFSMIGRYEDAAAQEKVCRDLAEGAGKDAILAEAVFRMAKDLPGEYALALQLLETVVGWKNADEKAQRCRERLRQFREIESREQQWKNRMRKTVKKAVWIALLTAAAMLALAVLTVWVVLPAVRYRNAMSYLEQGDTAAAYETLTALKGYRDSAEKAESVYFDYKTEILRQARVGDYVNFGKFVQTQDGSGIAGDISWLVLDKEDDRVLVLSRLALEAMPFHETRTEITWKDCTLRSWLNEEFYAAAFSPAEQDLIALTALDGKTQDRVFLLSVEEVEQYLPSKPDRWCDPTLYTLQQGAWIHERTYRCWWWLRTSGSHPDQAVYVGSEGTLQYGGAVHRDVITVRPAMWIELES